MSSVWTCLLSQPRKAPFPWVQHVLRPLRSVYEGLGQKALVGLGVTEALVWAEERGGEEPRAHGEEESVIFVLYVRHPGAFV